MIALLFGIRGFSNTILRIPAGQFADRVGYKIPLSSAFFLSAIAFLLISEVETFPILVIVMLIYGVSHGIRAVVEWTFIAISTPSTLRASISAYAETMVSMGDFLGAITAGVLTLVFPIPTIFKLGALILLPAILAPTFIQKDS
jgi:MFS family permease